MTKYFCDKCGDEITNKNECVGGRNNSERLGTEIRFKDPCDQYVNRIMKLELLVTFDGKTNDGCFCKYCILDAFRRLDDRPRTAPNQ